MSDSNKLDEKSSSTSNILSFSSAPSSKNDPNDEIWIEFLNSLNQQAPSGSSAEKNSEQNPNSDEDPNEGDQTADNDDAADDDAADDPDFTVCLENCDLEEAYFPDACFQVPKREAVELVKDAIEICDGAPIVYDDKRHFKIKSAITIKKLQPENRTKILINRVSKLGGTVEPKASRALKVTIPESTKEFVPEFTEIQRKKLDEQLRNHVQLLAQSCLITYYSKEFRDVFDEAHNLLNILKDLNKNDQDKNDQNKNDQNKNDQNKNDQNKNDQNKNDQNKNDKEEEEKEEEEEEEEEEENSSNSEQKMVKLLNFEILNLDEALEIISNIHKIPEEELSMDLKQGVPSKFLEIILKSPVFYNTSLIPDLSKFRYYSQFKKAQFTETEKILLIMGFAKFKHLPKSECCECIKEHLLPIRSCEDIRKQLNNFSSSEQRQKQLKELLKRQRHIKTKWMHNYNFIKEVHYRCPFDQADHVQLPSQYTILLERIKLANVLRDSKKSLKDRTDNDKENEQRNRSQSILSEHIKNLEAIQIEEVSSEPEIEIEEISPRVEKISEAENLRLSQFQKIRPKTTKIANKRDRSSSPNKSNQDLDKSDIIILDDENDNKNSIIINLGSSSQTGQKNLGSGKKPTVINSQKNGTPMANNTLQPSFIFPASNLADMFSRPVSMINPTFIRPMGQNMPLIQQYPMMQQNPPVIIPAGFTGTLLIQPTIHIHSNSKKADLDKFCKIRPKEKTPDISPAKKKKN